MTRGDVQLCALVSLVLGCDSSSTDSITREECQRVRDHSAELRIKDVEFGDVTPEQEASARAAHKKNFAKSGGNQYLDSCVETRDRDWLDCALRAKTLNDVEACS